MSETASTGDTAAVETAPADAPTTDNSKTPEWYESQITALRQEAANNRVKGKEKADATRTEVTTEYEAKLAESNTAHEETKGKLSVAERELLKVDVALNSGIPVGKVKEFARLLQGSNAEELKTHAETLKSLFGSVGEAAVDPSQGAGNSGVAAGPDQEFASFILGQLNSK